MGNCWSCMKMGASSSSQATPGDTRLPDIHGRENSPVRNMSEPTNESEILSSPNLKAFTFSELKKATRNFDPDSLLGEGGFGYVHKGWIGDPTLEAVSPEVRIAVAVKNLKPQSYQGHEEWLAEIKYLGQLHHPNLVKLIGFCLEGENRLLVYEYMPRGSLKDHLSASGARPLSWPLRIKVATGAARGLSFLHNSEQKIIYRDLKAENILLDTDFTPKLSDFGSAKAGPTGGRTHVSTRIIGSQGYTAPEYFATGRLTAKCDVYSFGVVLLELLTGRRAYDRTKVDVEQNLVDWARHNRLGDRRKLSSIMDINLQDQYPQNDAHQVAILASQCIMEAKDRPSMTEVLSALERLPLPGNEASSSNSAPPTVPDLA